MCDTLVVVRPGSVLFAKNSDRDANEAQVLDWQPRRSYPAGERLLCTWTEIHQVERTWAVLLSRPFWMWGAEMGTNEHGVTIGNEAVFTRRPKARTGLTGMDLVRLALERAAHAEEAAAVITGLLEEHGQGGGCGFEKPGFTYHNSFLIADRRGAIVLETAGREWASERVETGVRTISNALSIPEFARTHSDILYTRVACGRSRQARSTALAAEADGCREMMRALRDHGPGKEEPRYRWLGGTLHAACMHGGGALAGSVSTASWVSELTEGGDRHWATATSAPCLALFKPVAVDDPLDLGTAPTGRYDEKSLWWRHERLHRAVLADPPRLGAPIREERDEVEARWLARPPAPRGAFAEADELLARWVRDLGASTRDVRPFWARRYWRTRNAQAGLEI